MKDVCAFPARFLFLLTAIAVYAVAGSPTPDHPGWIEGIIGVLLVLGAGAGAAFAFRTTGLPVSLKIFCILGLVFPTVVGCVRGYDIDDIARDIAAFLCVCLPLFFAPLIARDPARVRVFIGAIIGLGIIFCLRALGPAYGYMAPAYELYYLTNAPTVLFSAIFLTGIALHQASAAPFTVRRGLYAMVAILGVLMILWAMLLDVQRATIGAVLISLVLGLSAIFIRAPRRMAVPFIMVILFGALFLPVWGDAMHAMAHKTARVGLNMRLEEMRAVLATITRDPASLLFGMGWGAKMASPAVGGVSVAFTHSFLSYIVLKAGLMGLMAALGWLWTCARYGLRLMRRDLMTGLALGWALVIPVFLYASHKSLDFGVILLLITVLADGCNGRVASAKAPV